MDPTWKTIILCPEDNIQKPSLISAGPRGDVYLLSGGRRHRELNRDPNGCRLIPTLIAQEVTAGKSNRDPLFHLSRALAPPFFPLADLGRRYCIDDLWFPPPPARKASVAGATGHCARQGGYACVAAWARGVARETTTTESRAATVWLRQAGMCRRGGWGTGDPWAGAPAHAGRQSQACTGPPHCSPVYTKPAQNSSDGSKGKGVG